MAQPATKGSSVSERRAAASPAVRALAREKGIDLAGLKGTGPDGTITRADVEAAAGSVKSSGGDPLRGVRRTMAINMAKSHAEVVPATLWDEANIHSWWERGHGVTVRVIRAIAKACNAEPLLNTWFDAKSMSIRISKQVDLGIAVDTEDGLIVPVLRDVGNRDLDALRCDLDALKAAVRHRTVPLADLRDPTLTLSNFGTIAGRQGALVILPPQAAIVGVGGVSLQAIPQGDAVGFTHTLPLSLTFDHRIVSGGEAARFLKAMIGDLEIAQ